MINEKKPNEYQIKVPERVVNNFLSIYMQSDGMITIYWDDSKEDENVNETKFPETSGGWYEITLLYDPEEVHDWFRRCIADSPKPFPSEGAMGFPVTQIPKGTEYFFWFQRWFSQFIEKGDKDE